MAAFLELLVGLLLAEDNLLKTPLPLLLALPKPEFLLFWLSDLRLICVVGLE
jgi:hypothetical protein